jgi:outer membrane protein
MNRILFLFISLPSILSASAQNDMLDAYIQTALDSNLALRQKEYSYQKSLEALKEAKRMFLPTVSFDARYSVAEGGRTVEIPFGDMLNPVYSNLNQINQSTNPSAPTYPQIENPELNFVRSPEQETKLVAVLPVFNASIIQNHKIKAGLVEVDKMSVDIYKRELVKEVKNAYVQYFRAGRLFLLYENTLNIVSRNLRNRESLFKNHKITIDEVYAAKAQVKQAETDLAEASKNKLLAISWFNFLLNRDFDAEIVIHEVVQPTISEYNLQDITNKSVDNREELKQLDQYLEIQTNKIDLQKGSALPTVSLFGQYGIQGTDYNIDSESDMAIFGASMRWDLFTSGQRKSKIKQAEIDYKITEGRKMEAERQIQLQAIEAYYSIQTAKKRIELAQEELIYTKKSYNLIEKKYQQGMVNYLEYSSSLNNKINAENKLILAQYNFQMEQIKLERLTSSYQF